MLVELTPVETAEMRALAAILDLKRPLIFVDLETTGLRIGVDRIVELGAIRLAPPPPVTPEAWVVTVFRQRFNPEIPISPVATAIHGISNADVATEQSFATAAPKLVRAFAGADLAGFNIKRFDAPFLQAEFARCGHTLALDDCYLLDVQTIYHRKEPRGLAQAVRFYLDREHEGAHSAFADIHATAQVLYRQFARYPDLPMMDLGGLVALFDDAKPIDSLDEGGKVVWDNGEARLTFGKHKDRALRDVPATYLQWFLGTDNVKPKLRKILSDALKGVYPTPPRRT